METINKNPTDVQIGFELLLKEIKRYIDSQNGIGVKAFEEHDYELVRNIMKQINRITVICEKVDSLAQEWQQLTIGTTELVAQQKMPQIPVVLRPHAPQDDGPRVLGRKGNENLEDYLLPVIKRIYSGMGYRDAFHQVADELKVRYNTVSSQCTRALKLTTAEFEKYVKSRQIVRVLKDKFPDRGDLIDRELGG